MVDRAGSPLATGKTQSPRQSGLILLWVLLIALDILAAVSALRLNFDDGVDRVFASKTQRYLDMVDFRTIFGSGDGEIFLTFEGADLSEPAALASIEAFLIEAQFLDNIGNIMSPFSLLPPFEQGIQSLTQPEIAKTLQLSRQETPELRRLVSEDRQLMLVIVALSGGHLSAELRGAQTREIEALAREMTAGQSIRVNLTGYPVLRERVVAKLFSDFTLLNVVGAVVGFLVAALTLRSLRLALTTSLVSATALLWVLGLLGAAGLTINLITVALPVLILVLSFADSLHLTLEVRRLHKEGVPNPGLAAVRRVGPACLLASVTTMIAFASLMLSPSELITGMGMAGTLSVLVAVLVVLFVHPLFFVTLDRLFGLERVFGDNRGRPGRLTRLSVLPDLAHFAPRSVAAAGVLVLLLAVAGYSTITPRHSIYDNMSEDDSVMVAIAQIEDRLGPFGSLKMALPLSGLGAESVAALKILHDRISQLAQREVFSLVTLADRLASERAAGQGGVGQGAPTELAPFKLEQSLNQMPQVLRAKLISKDMQNAILTIPYNYQNAVLTRAFVSRLEQKIAADPLLVAAGIGPLTGIETVSAFISKEMLLSLNRSFLMALGASGILIALWLRSPLIGAVALIPNVLPVALVGAWLALSGRGLEFSSGIAMTVAFGLAIDDTVHVLNRIRLNNGARIRLHAALIDRSMREVAPALTISSAVMTLGMTGTLFAALPSVAYFGMLSIAVFVLALVADMLVLPACLSVLVSWQDRRRGEGRSRAERGG
jgi:uncharacterized protein